MTTGQVALDRIRVVTGSRLVRDDIDGLLGYESSLFELHRCGLHHSWGIARGLTVSVAGAARDVVVQAGAGLPRHGDPLVLPAAVTARPPAGMLTAAMRFDLVLAPECHCHDADAGLPICDGERRHPDAATLRWVPVPIGTVGLAPRVRLGVELPLARVSFAPDGRVISLSGGERRVARQFEPYRMSGAETILPASRWLRQGDALLATIDLTSAGFLLTPEVIATISSEQGGPQQLIGPFVTVVDRVAASFTLSLTFARPPAMPLAAARAAELLWADGARCRWIAVEIRRCDASIVWPPLVRLPGGFP